jgi:hypothetical protein
MIKKLLIVLSFFFLCFAAKSQTSNLGSWYAYFGSKKINEHLNWHHEVQYRNYNAIGDLEQLLLRTGLGYNLSPKNNNILLGYGYISSKDYDSSNSFTRTAEHRIFQQFITQQKFKNIRLQHRYRVEQQFLPSNFTLRFRYFLSTQIGFKKTPSFYLSAYNEIFITANNNPFNRNRIYGGIGYKVNDYLRFEIGYMNQIFKSSSRDQMNLLVFANF